MIFNAWSTPSLPDGSTYRCSSLTSLHLQAKGSEYSFATRRRVPERKSPNKRRDVGVRNSSSGPCVPNLSIEPNCELLTRHFRDAAKVIRRWLRRSEQQLPSPPVNNFGGTIRVRRQVERDAALAADADAMRSIQSAVTAGAVQNDGEPVPGEGTVPLILTTGDAEKNREFFAEYKVGRLVLLQNDEEVAKAYLANGTPSGYLISAEGKIASDLAMGAE